MAFTRRQIWTTLSVLYLLTFTALAAYALHDANALSLPVPNILSAFALALPALSGVALETSMSMNMTNSTKRSAHVRPYVLQIVSAFFLVYEAVIATLAGTHLAPSSSLGCALREQWLNLFRNKDSKSIRLIQDRLDCCGLASPQDMAWPFPEAREHHGADACVVRYQRSGACLEPWREAERRVAGILLAVALGMFVWQMLFLYIGRENVSPAWLPSTLSMPEEHDDRTSHRRRIAYRDEEEPTMAGDIDGEIERLNADSQLSTQVESARTGRNSRAQQVDNELSEPYRD